MEDGNIKDLNIDIMDVSSMLINYKQNNNGNKMKEIEFSNGPYEKVILDMDSMNNIDSNGNLYNFENSIDKVDVMSKEDFEYGEDILGNEINIRKNVNVNNLYISIMGQRNGEIIKRYQYYDDNNENVGDMHDIENNIIECDENTLINKVKIAAISFGGSGYSGNQESHNYYDNNDINDDNEDNGDNNSNMDVDNENGNIKYKKQLLRYIGGSDVDSGLVDIHDENYNTKVMWESNDIAMVEEDLVLEFVDKGDYYLFKFQYNKRNAQLLEGYQLSDNSKFIFKNITLGISDKLYLYNNEKEVIYIIDCKDNEEGKILYYDELKLYKNTYEVLFKDVELTSLEEDSNNVRVQDDRIVVYNVSKEDREVVIKPDDGYDAMSEVCVTLNKIYLKSGLIENIVPVNGIFELPKLTYGYDGYDDEGTKIDIKPYLENQGITIQYVNGEYKLPELSNGKIGFKEGSSVIVPKGTIKYIGKKGENVNRLEINNNNFSVHEIDEEHIPVINRAVVIRNKDDYYEFEILLRNGEDIINKDFCSGDIIYYPFEDDGIEFDNEYNYIFNERNEIIGCIEMEETGTSSFVSKKFQMYKSLVDFPVIE